MENIQGLKEAVTLGLLVEISLRKRLHRLKQRHLRHKTRRKILRHLRRKKHNHRHRLPADWKNIAVDGWDGMVI